jgi:hypothetical protein
MHSGNLLWLKTKEKPYLAAFRETSYSVKSSCLAFLEGLLAQLTRLCDGFGLASDLMRAFSGRSAPNKRPVMEAGL